MKKTDRSAELLAGIYHDDWTGGVPAGFAREAAAAARQRRATRSREFVGLLAIAAAIAIVFSQGRSVPPPAPPTATRLALPSSPSVVYEIISDEQLLAQLHDQSVMIVADDTGAKRLMLLDETGAK